MLPTLGVADKVHPFGGLLHDGDHSLSEPLHLFPQGPQALSAIEEIKHCHHSPGVCLWERGNAATGVGLWDATCIHWACWNQEPGSRNSPHASSSTL